MVGKKRARSRYVIAAGLAITALTAVSAAPANAAVGDNKTYTVDIDGTNIGASPAVWAGDRDATITAVITNTGPSQSLGSVNLTVPAPFTLVSAPADAVLGGPVVELRNLALAPGASVTIALTVDVRTCSSASGTFTLTAKQSNDYNGTGNDFFLSSTADKEVATTGTCKLGFVAQPADAESNATITSVDYVPSAAAVSVEVRDAGGTGRIGASTPVAAPIVLGLVANPGATSLTGTTSATPVAGIATFSPKLAVGAFGYSLNATSTGLVTAPTSNSFDIVDDQVNCPGNSPCSQTATASKNGQTLTANFGTGSTPTNLLLSLGAADAPAFECSDYPRAAGTLVSQYLFTNNGGNDRVGTFTVSFPDASRPLNNYEVCWNAPYDFMTDSGQFASVHHDVGDGNFKSGTTQPLFVGTLPDCPKKGTLLPCVASRAYQRSTSSVVITVRSDGRDPWAY